MGSKIPKCKECEYHKYKSQNGWDKERHYCCEPSKLAIGSFIKASEYKTSPQWCPKRKKKYPVKETYNADVCECVYCGHMFNGRDAMNANMDYDTVTCPKCKKDMNIDIDINFRCTALED